ncbi:MAG: hypothetical protein GAK35_04277 [Herbaspirillum frisingense]|uniref:Uncharacterized protein n=1 Tax=Herbaspirillum frisingense TaxID=92645 RepID=A0A7V8JSD3_9BURK|nr:MAG: hypothetical protein GAK35_04277 [Herbaspirillum frisingense]
MSAQRGLGYLIASSSVNMSLSTMFAGVVLLALVGLCGAQAMRWLQARIVFWQPSVDRRE